MGTKLIINIQKIWRDNLSYLKLFSPFTLWKNFSEKVYIAVRIHVMFDYMNITY